MGGRKPNEAVEGFLGSVQKTVSCVTRSVLRPSKNGYKPTEEPHILTFSDDPVSLRHEEDFAMSIRHDYRIVRGEGTLYGRWKVKTVGYYYELLKQPNEEVISYHWHPESNSPLRTPHMHIGSGSGVTVVGMLKPHYPTPRMALEDFVLMLIKEFGVRYEREDWESVLSRSRAAYEAERAWQYHPDEQEVG